MLCGGVVTRTGHNIEYDVALGWGNMDKMHVCRFILINLSSACKSAQKLLRGGRYPDSGILIWVKPVNQMPDK